MLEKTMCADAGECEALLKLATRHERRVGVNHNFLFYPVYEQLRMDLRDGRLGRPDHLTITWNLELPSITGGPFDLWMLRDPANLMLEIGAHSVAHVLDLVGEPDDFTVEATNPIDLPGGRRVYRRWQVWAYCGRTAVELRFSFIPGFPERTVHLRGTLGIATADLHENTYVMRRHSRMSVAISHWREQLVAYLRRPGEICGTTDCQSSDCRTVATPLSTVSV